MAPDITQVGDWHLRDVSGRVSVTDEELYLDLSARRGIGEFGAVPVEVAVAEAADPDHPWHGRLTWDDEIAGHQYRLEQMRSIFRKIEINIVSTPEIQVRGVVHSCSEGGYISLPRVVSHPQLQAELLARAKSELSALRLKYSQLTHLSQVWDAIDSTAAAPVPA